MTSTTTSTPNATTPVLTIPNPFTKLGIDELTQIQATIQPTLNALATGDGTTTTLIGQWATLQGAFIASLPIFQKVGVNDGAIWLSSLISNGIADLKEKIYAQSSSSGSGTSTAA